MIVCSQTCFLNDLTQLMDKDNILKANYYMADQTGPGNIAHLNPENANYQMMYLNPNSDDDMDAIIKYNEDGQMVKTGQPPVICETTSQYNIKYMRGALNPSNALTHLPLGGELQPRSTEERFMSKLKESDVAVEIYEDLFYHKPKGNGLQVLVYSNDEICTKYGWIACEYLSSCFGADIIFLDAIYRTKIAKQAKKQYVGNKQYGAQFVQWIRDQKFIRGINRAITRAGIRETVANITKDLVNLTWPNLIHAYNILWPNDPLPQGNYSEEQLRELIIHKCLESRPASPLDALDNLYSGDAFYQMAEDYDV